MVFVKNSQESQQINIVESLPSKDIVAGIVGSTAFALKYNYVYIQYVELDQLI